ncbi:MAG: hypothetical protein ACK54P_05155, partial [Bacteroidota bacterium]
LKGFGRLGAPSGNQEDSDKKEKCSHRSIINAPKINHTSHERRSKNLPHWKVKDSSGFSGLGNEGKEALHGFLPLPELLLQAGFLMPEAFQFRQERGELCESFG